MIDREQAQAMNPATELQQIIANIGDEVTTYEQLITTLQKKLDGVITPISSGETGASPREQAKTKLNEILRTVVDKLRERNRSLEQIAQSVEVF